VDERRLGAAGRPSRLRFDARARRALADLPCTRPKRRSPRALERVERHIDTDLATARHFYGDLLGCSEGRSATMRCDFDFFGHHPVVHVEPQDDSHKTTDLDSFGVKTPARHFGVVLPQDDWKALASRLESARADFYTEPQTVFPCEVKEQQIMLIHDGCGNIVEFKASPLYGLFQGKIADGRLRTP
jgi:extradiol dioxygenase family protein